MHFLSFIAIEAGAILLVRYAKWLRDSTGIRSEWAEGFFGPGGTITLMKAIGVLGVVFGFYYYFNM